MSTRVHFALPALALLSMACGIASLIPGENELQTALTQLAPALSTAGVPGLDTPAESADVTAAGLPEFESDEDKVIELVEGGQTHILYDLINESDQGEMLEPGVQRYTADIQSDDLIDLSTGWCAKDNSIMEDNEKHITGSIQVDDYVIPEADLVAFSSEVGPGDSNDYPDGLSCYSWDIVATKWPTGIHRVTESWTLDMPLDDGYAKYKAGKYAIEYTITVRQ